MEHSLETLQNCPACGGKNISARLECIDYTYSKKPFKIVGCATCNLQFTNPRPPLEAIGPYYNNPEYVSHTDTNKGLLFTLYGAVKNFTLTQKRKQLESYKTNKTILEYGAGSGDFAAELASHGWKVTAYEPDKNARQKIGDKNKEVTLIEELSIVEPTSKDIITLWHVLEHVHPLQETLDAFHRILTRDGYLIIAVPNHTSLDAQFYAENWAAYDVPRHLYHFNPASLEKLLKQKGFELIKKKPMWFDSIYVSLLSEKNSRSTSFVQSALGWLRASCVGFISNINALFSPEKCSSVTYVFKKAK